MGRWLESFKVYYSVSRHNSEQDEIDDALAEELLERVRAIANESRYQSIYPGVD